MSDDIIAEIRRDYIYNLAKKGERVDGRAFDEYRQIEVETRLIDRAEGSAKVKIGNTQVLVGIKIQPGEPFPDTPDQGAIITNVELAPLASPSFEPGPPDESATELARVVDRGVRESGAIDLAKLCIEKGENIWMVFIDVYVLDHDGNLMDASALGAIAALLNAELPNERYELGKDAPLPIDDLPVAVTAAEINGEIMLDPSLDEELIASTQLTVITSKDGSLAGMQKSGVGMLTFDQIHHIIDIASKKAKEIREKYLETS
ncbi:MAG: exosome complex protein Rrp42 [Methanocellales archaeon]|nr:exosome complex protein Rrp42 [Methanocellales archaeon]MDI6903523.1 exosome complex protein Rrp42 [Methanocellales archaeon]